MNEFTSQIDAYFAAWNAHDGDAVAALFGPHGHYEDPTTNGPISPQEVVVLLRSLSEAFPDLSFERTSQLGDETRQVVEWVMRGHNLGPLQPGIEPTEREIALKGLDVFEWDQEHQGFRHVRGYFDQRALIDQVGLMSLIQPFAQGAATFGYSMRVVSGNPRPPGAIALTWIAGKDEAERDRIRAHARQNVQDFMEEPGFISIVTGFLGLRGFTVTAWEDEAAMKRALAGHHAEAMRELFQDDFVASVWTSVWSPTRINRLWVRCASCASLEDVSDDHRRCHKCAQPLPERPPFW